MLDSCERLLRHDGLERPLPRFFFHLRTETQFIPDTQGKFLAGAEDARHVASIAARELIEDVELSAEHRRAWITEVADERDCSVVSFPVLAMMQ